MAMAVAKGTINACGKAHCVSDDLVRPFFLERGLDYPRNELGQRRPRATAVESTRASA